MSPWRAILAMASVRWWLFVLAGLGASIAAYAFPLAPGLIIRPYFDTLSGGAIFGPEVWTPLLILAAIAVVRAVVTVIAVAAERGLQLVVGTLLRRNVLDHILHQPGARSLPASAGEAISRLRDDVQAVGQGLSWTLDPVGQLLIGGFAVTVLLRIDPTLTIAVLAPLVVVIGIVRLVNNRIRSLRETAQQSIGNVTGLLVEVFGAAMAIKVANAEERVVAYLREVNEARRRATLADRVFTQFVNSAAINVANIGTGVMLLLAAGAMSQGRFSVGDFAVFVAYIAGLMPSVVLEAFVTVFAMLFTIFTKPWRVCDPKSPAHCGNAYDVTIVTGQFRIRGWSFQWRGWRNNLVPLCAP